MNFVKVFWKKPVSLQYCKYPETRALGTHSFTLVADIANEVGSKMHFKRGRWLHGDDAAAALILAFFKWIFHISNKKCNNAWEQNVLDIIHLWKNIYTKRGVSRTLENVGSFMWRVEDKQSWSRSYTDDEKHLKGWRLCFSL